MRNGREGGGVEIEDRAIGAIADRVGLDLDPAPERFRKHRAQVRFLLGEKTGGIRRIGVGLEERGAA